MAIKHNRDTFPGPSSAREDSDSTEYILSTHAKLALELAKCMCLSVYLSTVPRYIQPLSPLRGGLGGNYLGMRIDIQPL